jgi:hypothetical protein
MNIFGDFRVILHSSRTLLEELGEGIISWWHFSLIVSMQVSQWWMSRYVSVTRPLCRLLESGVLVAQGNELPKLPHNLVHLLQ